MDENKTIMTTPKDEGVQLDAAYVILKIDHLMADSVTLHKALELLQSQSMSGEAVMGLSNMIEARERTNQAMIDLLKRIVVQKL